MTAFVLGVNGELVDFLHRAGQRDNPFDTSVSDVEVFTLSLVVNVPGSIHDGVDVDGGGSGCAVNRGGVCDSGVSSGDGIDALLANTLFLAGHHHDDEGQGEANTKNLFHFDDI